MINGFLELLVAGFMSASFVLIINALIKRAKETDHWFDSSKRYRRKR
jgi:hypothetical protein